MAFLNSKKNVSAEEQARHKQILTSLIRDPGNKTCVDCGCSNPTWCVSCASSACWHAHAHAADCATLGNSV